MLECMDRNVVAALSARRVHIETKTTTLTRLMTFMARFFIDTDDGDTRTRDPQGSELEGPEQARDAALNALPEMVRRKITETDRRTFRAIARDNTGKLIYRATLAFTGTWD